MTDPFAALKIVAFPVAAKLVHILGSAASDFRIVNEWGPVGILAAGCFYLEALRRRQAVESQEREKLALERQKEELERSIARENALLQELRKSREENHEAQEAYKQQLEHLLTRCQACADRMQP